MSKNVAVFVDVANIFYAAKAAGVDIDYVTLLKSATAGRDFVRAYAYTGLDPENENQRQFHAFLARSGYKVVSKDIRKYGDGRIKANLDIELVVDMMRTARNLDVAVVVSGDGDFAPAIRAVQQQGVRVEVISFRGNTSSDLIEVADVFTDITQIARVEKSSVRSGRRIAAEDDLSMTEVPDKETEGLARRRRGRGRPEREVGAVRAAGPARGERTDRGERAVASRNGDAGASAGMPGNLIVLPGEKLSRVGAAGEDEPLDGADAAADLADIPEMADGEAGEAGGVAPLGGGAGELAALDGEGRRRRRRRGGRGRGRGRRGEGEVEVAGSSQLSAEEEDLFEDEPAAPSLPPHSTFGSVWDTQLGVPSVPLSTAASDVEADDLEDEEEPEIPEYLLAERRQRARRSAPRGRERGRAGGYQAALDRERFGRGGGAAPGGFGGGSGRPPTADRGRPDRQGVGPRGPRQGQGQGGRADRFPVRPDRPRFPERSQRARSESPAGGSSEPWSEVPPEVQELLRAELARRSGDGGTPAQPRPAEPSLEGTTEDMAEDVRELTGESREALDAVGGEATNGASPEIDVPARRAGRRRTGNRAAEAGPSTNGDTPALADTLEEPPSTELAAFEASPEAPARRGRRRATPAASAGGPTEAAETGEESPAASGQLALDAATGAPVSTRRRTPRPAARVGEVDAVAGIEADGASTAPATGLDEPSAAASPRRRTARGKTSASAPEAVAPASAAGAAHEPTSTPTRRRAPRRATAAGTTPDAAGTTPDAAETAAEPADPGEEPAPPSSPQRRTSRSRAATTPEPTSEA